MAIYNDLISRQKVLDSLGVFNDRVNGNEHFLFGIETAQEIVANLDSEIDAEELTPDEKQITRSIKVLKSMNSYYASFANKERSDALSVAIRCMQEKLLTNK